MAVGEIVGSSLGFGLDAIVQLWGMKKAADERERANELSMRLYREKERKEDRRYKESMKITKSAIREKKLQARKEWKWREEQDKYAKGMDMFNNFVGLADRSPAFKQQLGNIWG